MSILDQFTDADLIAELERRTKDALKRAERLDAWADAMSKSEPIELERRRDAVEGSARLRDAILGLAA